VGILKRHAHTRLGNPNLSKPPLVNLILWATRVGWVASKAIPEFAAHAKLSYIAATPFKENLVFAPRKKWERRLCNTSIALTAHHIHHFSVIDNRRTAERNLEKN
jgi:hypothetical protein